MRKIYCILVVFLLFTQALIAQNIGELFILLPDSAVHHLTKQERSNIVNHAKDNHTTEDALDDMERYQLSHGITLLDLNNGYLELIGAFEGYMSLCYWNTSSKSKIVAIYEEACGPECFPSSLSFYKYENKKWQLLDMEIDIDNLGKYFFNNYAETLKAMDHVGYKPRIVLELPRKGKNIRISWENSQEAAPYQYFNAKGFSIDLLWTEGKFIPGKALR